MINGDLVINGDCIRIACIIQGPMAPKKTPCILPSSHSHRVVRHGVGLQLRVFGALQRAQSQLRRRGFGASILGRRVGQEQMEGSSCMNWILKITITQINIYIYI